MPRPRCGNDPRARLTPEDRQAIADFRAYLAHRAQEKTMPDLDQARADLQPFAVIHGFTDRLEAFEAAVRANERAGATRAAVLLEAAQHLYTALFPAVYDDMGQKAAEGVNRAVSELRRLAAGAQQHEPETAERPRCPHCQMPHDLTPGMELVCASIRASISDTGAQRPAPRDRTAPPGPPSLPSSRPHTSPNSTTTRRSSDRRPRLHRPRRLPHRPQPRPLAPHPPETPMRLLTHALTVLYGTAGVILIGAAKAADDRHATGWSALLLGCAFLAGIAVLHHSVLRARVHRLERAARPPGPHPAAVSADVRRGLHALATACCLPAALTDGHDHDTTHCTRKDQTT